jgi:hypothetical protein
LGIALADGNKTIVARWKLIGLQVWGNMKTPAGCSKMLDFSPAQPWRAETRLVPNKAAAVFHPISKGWSGRSSIARVERNKDPSKLARSLFRDGG